MQEEMTMIDQQTDIRVADRIDWLKRMAQPADVRQVITAIIATTRREWMSPSRGSPATDEAAGNRAGSAHPLIRFALDAKRVSVWRARADRQGLPQSVEPFAISDRTT
jgi:hypothetical protein